MHGGGPSPSGSSFLHSYGLAAVSRAHTSASGRFPKHMKMVPVCLAVVSELVGARSIKSNFKNV
jgi:hypothetical protein